MRPMSDGYFKTLAAELGQGWNRFWFAPGDPFTLGVIRVAAGLMALYLLATYTPRDLDRYFSSDGLVRLDTLRALEEQTRDDARQMLPGQIREAMPREYRFSYLDYFHSQGGLITVHALGMGVLLLFTAGLFTRIMSVAALVVVLSYLHRGPMLTSQVEPILAFVLFYLCLGPAGASCSLDQWRTVGRRRASVTELSQPAENHSSPWATVSLRLIQVHQVLVYAMMAVGKLGGSVSGENGDYMWWNGLGMWYVIARTKQRMIDVTVLNKLPLLVHAWSYAVMFWQLAFPIFVWNRLARPLMLGLSAVMWALLAPVIGNIPLAVMMIVASLAFVP